MTKTNYAPIEEYGIIGNCITSALVHKTGSIDFFCYPNFESPSVFAKILDHKKGGFFHTKPNLESPTITQQYLTNTNVLLTRYITEEVLIDIIDFMPFDELEKIHSNEIIRVIKCIRGQAEIAMHSQIAFDYGTQDATGSSTDTHTILYTGSKDGDEHQLEIKASIDLIDSEDQLISSFTIKKEEAVIFRIGNPSEAADHDVTAFVDQARSKLRTTVTYWQDWMNKSTYVGDHTSEINRSALLLKLLTPVKFGAPIAAPTFSLPEVLGGKKNWDYRYTWVRDASFTMYAFIRLGYLSEASKFMIWIQERLEEDIEKDVKLQIMYRSDGSKDLSESELEHFEGYEQSQPVRIGNAATEQLQLDIYGELLDTIYLFDKYGEPIPFSTWKLLIVLIDKVCKEWNQPDHGIWEVREVKRHYLYSRVMCWVALDRAIRLAEKHSFACDEAKWKENRNLIFTDIYDNFWDEDLQSYVHFKGAKTQDVSLLIMPLVRIMSPYDKRWLSTMKKIEETLVTDVLVYRNMNDEDPKCDENREGTFVIGAFWYIECLSRMGELEKASYYFQKLNKYANHLGLFAEELLQNGRFAGNFPQAFSHLGLISTAYSLNRNTDECTFTITEKYDLF